MNLIQHPTGEVVLDTGYKLLTFDGTPLQRPTAASEWPVVGTGVKCLFDWQRDAGSYGPHYAVGTVIHEDGNTFVAGGSLVFINAWCNERGAIFQMARLFSDRNEARRRAEERGGVAW